MQASKKLRVLVIDDELVLCDAIKKALQVHDCEVRTFQNPISACYVSQNLGRNCVNDSACTDVLITDMRMPDMDGIELLKLQKRCGCKAQAANKALMSALATPQQQADVKELGCHFFQKPFKLSEILHWINECTNRIHGTGVEQ
jgi:CheY-like chemotaxis protein